VLEPDQFARRLGHEHLHRILIRDEVTALDGVVGMKLEAVVLRAHDRRRSALGGHGMAAHGVDLGNEGDGEAGVRLDGGDGGPDTRAATSHDHDVVDDRIGKGHGFSSEEIRNYPGTSVWSRAGSARKAQRTGVKRGGREV
jgi:hypothetical protein